MFAETPEKFDPRDYLKPAREAMKKVVAERMQEFGQAGHGKDYTPLPIAKMAEGYKSGALDTRPSVAADGKAVREMKAAPGWSGLRVFVGGLPFHFG